MPFGLIIVFVPIEVEACTFYQEGRAIIRAVIFDVDGTLIDTVDMHARAWQEAFEYFGRQFSFEAVRSQIGKGGDQLMPHFLTEEEMETFGEELSQYRKEHWKRNYLPNVKPFASTRELFELIRRDGKQVLLASSSAEDELMEYAKIARVHDIVDGTVSASDVSASKPEPDILIAAAGKAGSIGYSEIAMIGDSPYDAIAAAQIGMPMIGLRSGGFSDEELIAEGAVEMYDDPQDLLYRYEQSLIGRSE